MEIDGPVTGRLTVLIFTPPPHVHILCYAVFWPGSGCGLDSNRCCSYDLYSYMCCALTGAVIKVCTLTGTVFSALYYVQALNTVPVSVETLITSAVVRASE